MFLLLYNFCTKSRYDKHTGNCSGITGDIYKFHNQNLVTFKENLKFEVGISIVGYRNFEKTTTSGAALGPKNTEIFSILFLLFILI